MGEQIVSLNQDQFNNILDKSLSPDQVTELFSYLNTIAYYSEKIYGTLMIGFSLMLGIFILCVFYKLLMDFGR